MARKHEYKEHQAANVIRMMTDEEYAAMRDDIQKHGLIEPIVLYEGKILDGRNRYKACMEIGIEPHFVQYEGKSPVQYVRSANYKRRHLTKYELVLDALEEEPGIKAKAKERQMRKPKSVGQISAQQKGKVRNELATVAGVSHDTVEKVKLIEQHISPETKEQLRKGEISINAVHTTIKRKQKEDKREERRQSNRMIIEQCERTGEHISEFIWEGPYATILIDPPWDWGDEGDVNQLGRAKPDYHTMSYEELLEEGYGDTYADVDCHLYCWVTNRSMPKVFSLIEAWGFRYVTLLTWPKPSFGMGNYFRGQTEHIVFGIKGSQPLARKNASTLLPPWPRGKKHSSKPKEIYEFIESCSPGPYLEIYGRDNQREEWTVIGIDA